VALWVLAATYLSLTGHAPLVLIVLAASVLPLLIFGLLTIPLTAGKSTSTDQTVNSPSAGGHHLGLQLGILFAVIILTGYRGMVFNHALPSNLTTIPLWTPFVDALDHLWAHVFAFPATGTNPTLYVLLPGAAMLLLGVPLRTLGIVRGLHAWRVAVLWTSVDLVVLAAALVIGRLSVLGLLRSFLSNLLQNGFSEEFLFRGALLARLRWLWGDTWAAVLSSLAFGLWHLGTDTSQVGGSNLAGAALGIISQATFGLSLAIVFLRTQNLLAPTLIHVLGNWAGVELALV
jgi:membrane protease YdiL (CAAX protease family)